MEDKKPNQQMPLWDEEITIVWPSPGTVITTQNGMEYKVGTQLDSGGFALVFEGTDLFGNPVALKVFKPANRPFEEVRSQWDKETKLFEKLRHPNVVAIYDAFVCDNLFYIILERAWGNICRHIDTVKPISELYVREIARQLLFGIHFIHSHGVVHRDITIYNSLVFEGPQSRGPIFKISDFGISKEFVSPWEDKICHTHIAHPCFIPPELIIPEHGYTSERSDLYHLGLILLYAYTGNLPFNETMEHDQIRQIIQEGIPRQKAESIGTALGDFISVLLRRRDQYRYQTALEAWKALCNTPSSVANTKQIIEEHKEETAGSGEKE
ncbi:MAG: serine/threonine-protein kinase [Planctomycetota bacterium]|jgi:serine/threonine-protein kinase